MRKLKLSVVYSEGHKLTIVTGGKSETVVIRGEIQLVKSVTGRMSTEREERANIETESILIL